MKHLIVYAHFNSSSLNASIKDAYVKGLKSKGHEVIVRDLYEMKFNPVLSQEDIASNYAGKLPEDIQREQEYIREADVITVISPIWWTGFPAVLKGYFDRVLLYGFAYKYDEQGLVKLLKGKKAVIINTTGQPKEVYEPDMYNALRQTSDNGVFDFCGIEVLQHIFYPSAMSSPDDVLQGYINNAEALAQQMN